MKARRSALVVVLVSLLAAWAIRAAQDTNETPDPVFSRLATDVVLEFSWRDPRTLRTRHLSFHGDGTVEAREFGFQSKATTTTRAWKLEDFDLEKALSREDLRILATSNQEKMLTAIRAAGARPDAAADAGPLEFVLHFLSGESGDFESKRYVVGDPIRLSEAFPNVPETRALAALLRFVRSSIPVEPESGED